MKNNIFVKIFNHIEEALLSVTFVIMTLICFIQVIQCLGQKKSFVPSLYGVLVSE